MGDEANRGIYALSFEVAGFELIAEHQAGRSKLTGPPDAAPLCEALNTAALYGMEGVLSGVAKRSGQSFEGCVSFAFHREHPEEVTKGHVDCDYFDTTLSISENDFAIAALSLVKCHLEAQTDIELQSKFRRALWRLRWLRWMRLPIHLTQEFTVKFRIDVVDTQAGHKREVSTVLSDGLQGRFVVIDPALKNLVISIFSDSQSAFKATTTGHQDDGFRADPAVEIHAPYSKAALDQLVSYGLSAHRLCGTMR